MVKKVISTVLIALISLTSTFAQDAMSKKEEKALTNKGEGYYSDEYYITAANIFEELNKANPDDLYYKLMLGICYSFITEKKELSLIYLLDVKEQNPEYSEVDFFIGRSYAVNHQFDLAIDYFNKYLTDPDLLPEDKEKARLFIANCNNAKEIVPDSLELIIENIGHPINTKYDEYVPIITPDERILIFTYRGEKSLGGRMDRAGNSDPNGEYYEDVMISYKSAGEWTEPHSIGTNINSIKHDASIAISASGNKLFTYKSSNKNSGDIYVSELKRGSWSSPSILNSEINSESWEGSASLTSDEKTLYFTSERPGGYGGRDLYKAELKTNGDWGNVQNLGPKINTRYDEDAPFIHPDGKTLYFSSKGHNSIGGYDIFYTYLDNGVWDSVSNVGFPVNTIEDDRYYVLTADGSKGYYSSAGKEDSYGGNDIYVVSPGHFGSRPILALIVGVTRKDGKETTADIIATDTETGDFANSTVSDENSGQFMISLIPGKKYKIAIEVKGAKTTYEYIDVESVQTFVQVNHDIDLYTNETPKSERKELNSQKENQPSLQEKLNEQIKRVREFAADTVDYSKIDLNERISKLKKYNKEIEKESEEEEFNSAGLEPANSKIISGLTFKVEIGAVRDTNDFKLAHLSKYGKLSRQLYEDGVYRYTFGEFDNLEEAENFRDLLVEKEPVAAKAFITVFVFGQRKTVDEFTEEYTLKGLEPAIELNQIVEIKASVENSVADRSIKTTELTQINEIDEKTNFLAKEEKRLEKIKSEEVVATEINQTQNSINESLVVEQKIEKGSDKKEPTLAEKTKAQTIEKESPSNDSQNDNSIVNELAEQKTQSSIITEEKTDQFSDKNEPTTEEEVLAETTKNSDLNNSSQNDSSVSNELTDQKSSSTISTKENTTQDSGKNESKTVDGILVESSNDKELINNNQDDSSISNELAEQKTPLTSTLKTEEKQAQINDKNEPILVEAAPKKTAEDSLIEKKMELMTDPCDKYTMEAFTAFILKDIKNEENYNRLLALVGPICHPDLHFEVQIGAYRKPNNFKYAHLLAFGDPLIRNYQDNITRFTQGEFKTFSDAEVLRQQIINKGTEDAWITPFYKGKRLLMQDLVKGTYENALGLN